MHWIALYVNDNNAIYFHSFGVEHIPKKKSKKILGSKKIKTSTYLNTSIRFDNVWILFFTLDLLTLC